MYYAMCIIPTERQEVGGRTGRHRHVGQAAAGARLANCCIILNKLLCYNIIL